MSALTDMAEADLAATLENVDEWAVSATHTYPPPGYASSETLTGFFAEPGEKQNAGDDVDIINEAPVFTVRASRAGNVVEGSRLVISGTKYLVAEIVGEGLVAGGLKALQLELGDW